MVTDYINAELCILRIKTRKPVEAPPTNQDPKPDPPPLVWRRYVTGWHEKRMCECGEPVEGNLTICPRCGKSSISIQVAREEGEYAVTLLGHHLTRDKKITVLTSDYQPNADDDAIRLQFHPDYLNSLVI